MIIFVQIFISLCLPERAPEIIHKCFNNVYFYESRDNEGITEYEPSDITLA